MKIARLSTTVAFCIALLGCEEQQRAEIVAPTLSTSLEQSSDESMPLHKTPSHHEQHEDMHSMLRLDQGQPWATDAPLVKGMEGIRDAVSEAAALPALDADSAAALARSVRDQVDFLVANCRLEPDADATLHVFIAQLLSAAAALESDPSSAEGMPRLQETLREYPRYFAHPGWRAESSSEG